MNTMTSLPAMINNNNDVEMGCSTGVGSSGGKKNNASTNSSNSNLPPEPVLDQGFLKPIAETTPIEKVFGIIALIAVTMALIAIIIEQSLIVIIAGILSILIGPYSYYQQTQLTDIRTLQETKIAIASEVDRLEIENKRLVKNIDTISESIDRLNEIDDALAIITTKQGQTITTFQEHVEDNKKILQSMKGNLKASVLQNLLSIILRTDIDNDSQMDDNEINSLITRIQNVSNGIVIHEDRFRMAISNGRSIKEVMEIIKNLMNNDTIPVNERIFEFSK